MPDSQDPGRGPTLDPAASPFPGVPETPPGWSQPPARASVRGDDVHLWRAMLDWPPEALNQALRVLSEEERARAGRASVDRARSRFVAARCVLRTILSGYLDVPAGAVGIVLGHHGKPELAPGPAESGLCFSVAHSRDWALVGVTSGRAIGVDVEFVRPLSDMAGLVARVFSAIEQEEYRSLPEQLRLEGFFRGWTGKEAWLKARAVGLTWPPNRFSVSLTPGLPLRLVEVRDDPEAARRWAMASFEVAPGCLGAVAVEGRGWKPAFFEVALHGMNGAWADRRAP